MYQLIASDLDGTLLRSDKTISSETVEVLSRCNDKGTLFVPTTGRTHMELPDVIMELPFLKYAITCNGGGAYDYAAKKYIFSFGIDNATGKEVLKFCRTLPVFPTMVCDGVRYIKTDETGDIPEFIRKNAAPGVAEKATKSPDLVKTLEDTGYDVQKIMIYPEGADRTQGVLDSLRDKFPSLFITTSGPLFVEINAPGIDKGKTLRLLCEHLDIPVEDTIAFGDAANDLAMLKAAGRAVVPENGTDEVKTEADQICPGCDDDGVRKTLEMLGF